MNFSTTRKTAERINMSENDFFSSAVVFIFVEDP